MKQNKSISTVLFITTLGLLANVHSKSLNKIEDLEPFQLDEYLNGTFKNLRWNGTWITDTIFLAKDDQKNLHQVNVPENKTELFLTADVFKDYPGNSITLAADLKYVLIRYNQKSIFRHSTTAQFAIYDIENRQYYDLHHKEHIQLAKWAPVGTGLVYVIKNDIYYVPKIGDGVNPIRITYDGVPGRIYNGVPDWVYEEEVLGSGSALWFSPDGKWIAFASFDDAAVATFHYFIYESAGNAEKQYPQVVSLKYPKVGSTNPRVSVKFVDLESTEKRVIELKKIIPVNVVGKDHVLDDITWATDTDVVAVSLNRVQNVAATIRCNVITETCGEVYIVEERHGWLDIEAPKYSKDGTKHLILSSEPEGNDSYRHLVLIDTTAIPRRRRLTYGKRIVSAIYGWDEPRNLIYYAGTVLNSHSQQHVFVYDLNYNADRCITCNFATPEGPCKVASASFSKGYSYIAKSCSGPGPALVHVQHTQTLAYFVWENNAIVREQLSHKRVPVERDINVPLTNGYEARVRLLLPPQLDENADVKYPMIVNVYAGPNSNRVSDSFSAGVEKYFVTNRKYIYAYIDGRGSGKNGNNLMYEIYRKLGTVEIEDQITVTKYLQDRYSFIDANKTGIWGWSYGGFSTIWTLIRDTRNVFRFGLAVAPVTNFIYYDSIYTERYMGLPTPDDNFSGYNGTDTTSRVEALRNKTFFLIHGNADDNVHYQQTMLLVKALERADISFYQQSYPDENHGLGGVSRHLYHTIDKFFDYGFKSRYPKKWKLGKNRKGGKARTVTFKQIVH